MTSASIREPLRVALVNDYEVVVRGLHAMLQPFDDRVAVVEIDVQLPVATPVDVTLYDTFSETQVDAEDIDEVVAGDAAGAVVVYTWNMDPRLVEIALAKGCRGYLDKALGGEDLVAALERVGRGEVVVSPSAQDPSSEDTRGDLGGEWPGRREGLSAREGEIVALITQGLTNVDIAARTYLSINSVKTYIRTAYRKMGVTRRSQAVRWGLEHDMAPGRRLRIVRDPDPTPARTSGRQEPHLPQAGT